MILRGLHDNINIFVLSFDDHSYSRDSQCNKGVDLGLMDGADAIKVLLVTCCLLNGCLAEYFQV